MRIQTKYSDRIENCRNCEEFEIWVSDKYCCGVTKQPLFLMPNCPMEDYRVRTDLDPCYYWFPLPAFAKSFCSHVAYGEQCQFKRGDYCVSVYGTYLIADMCRCPCPRFDIDGHKCQPRDNYPILRE